MHVLSKARCLSLIMALGFQRVRLGISKARAAATMRAVLDNGYRIEYRRNNEIADEFYISLCRRLQEQLTVSLIDCSLTAFRGRGSTLH